MPGFGIDLDNSAQVQLHLERVKWRRTWHGPVGSVGAFPRFGRRRGAAPNRGNHDPGYKLHLAAFERESADRRRHDCLGPEVVHSAAVWAGRIPIHDNLSKKRFERNAVTQLKQVSAQRERQILDR